MENLVKKSHDVANSRCEPVGLTRFKTYDFPILFWKWTHGPFVWGRSLAKTDYGNNITREFRLVLKKNSPPVTGLLFDQTNAYIREKY